jgi:hypothetical protein
VLTKHWSVVQGDQVHDVVVSWDLLATGGGLIVVDGVVQKRWLVGVKWPGVVKHFRVGDRNARVVQHGVTTCRLEVDGAMASELDAPPPSAEAVRWNHRGLLVLVGPVLGLIVLGAALLGVRAWPH